MLFPTVEFAIFFVLVFSLNMVCHQRPHTRKWLLVLASYIFYAFWDYRFTLLLLEASLVNYGLALWLERCPEAQKRQRILASGLAFNLGILGIFKYFGFFTSNFITILNELGLSREWQVWQFILPMGISFFTFQGISYIVDVYQRKITARHDVVDILLYISFFPQLVAGPIVRAKSFLPQIDQPYKTMSIRMTYAFSLIALGLFKKVLIAHYVAIHLVEPAFANPEQYGSFDLLMGVYGYAVQIYCDFSAYSDIAIGLAALLGFHFDKNFNQPYGAHSLSDFWRRWHISLSSWLRDYLYIPLGGNQLGQSKMYRNLLITMILGGLWHGAAWTFIIWGALHGLGLVVAKSTHKLQRWLALSHREQVFLTFHFVCLTWIFFRAEDLGMASQYLMSMSQIYIPPQLGSPMIYGLVLLCLASHYFPFDPASWIESKCQNAPILIQGTAFGAMVSFIAAAGPGALAPFIYFRF